MKTVYKFIYFTELKKMPGKWVCLNLKTADPLAFIEYYPAWRQHIAQFNDGCVFNCQCLDDISDFLKQLNEKKK